MDWKKEYRVSDVFRLGRERRGRPGAPDPDRPGGESPPGAPGPFSEPPGWALFADVPDLAPPDPTVWAIFADVPGATVSPVPAPGPEPGPAGVHPLPAPPAVSQPESEPAGEVSGSVWKKEIRLGGKRRGRKAGGVADGVSAAAEVVSSEPVAEPAASPGEPSVWKKEIRVSSLFSRSRRREVVSGPGAEAAAGPEPSPVVESQPLVDPVAADAAPAGAVPSGDVAVERSAAAPVAAEAPASVEVGRELPVAAAAPAAVSAWKKEYRVSDLFRGGKASGDGGAPPAVSQPESEPAGEVSGSVWKKEIRLGGKRRGRKAGAGQPDRRAPKRRRDRSAEPRSKRGDARGARPGGSPLDVPLARSINLLPREDEKTRPARLSLPGVAVGLVGVLVVGGLAFFTVYERARLTERQGDLEDLQAQAAAIETPEDIGEPDSGAELTGEALGRVSALTGALGERVAWDRLLREISLTLPDDVWLESLSTTQAGGTTDPATGLTQPGVGVPTLSITGYAVTQAGVAQLMARLAVIPQLSGVQLQSSTVVELGGENVLQFTTVATIAQSQGVVS